MFRLSDEEKLIVDSVSEIAENEFSEDAFTWEGDFPKENLKTLSDNGFLGLNMPEKYGGGGLSEYEVLLQIETIGKVCPDTAGAVYSQSMVAPRMIEMFGEEAIKEKYIPKVTSGEGAIAVALSEPEAGSDIWNMNTKVEEENDELILNGEKIWVSNFAESDAAVVWAMFPEGLGSVILDLSNPGIDVAEHYTNMYGGKQTHFFIEDVHIPKEMVLVRGEDELKKQFSALNWERCGSAIFSNAKSLCALRLAVKHAKNRIQFDQPLSEFQGIQWKIADMVTDLQSSRAISHQAAKEARDKNKPPDRLHSSIAKLKASETVEQIVSECLQIHGASGYQKGHPLEYLYRYARGRRIGGGTDEIMKNTISSYILSEGLGNI